MLELESGKTLAESGAILLYLAEGTDLLSLMALGSIAPVTGSDAAQDPMFRALLVVVLPSAGSGSRVVVTI